MPNNKAISSPTPMGSTRFAEKTPWEFKLLGYKPDKWSAVYSISRMVGYLTLAQSQTEIEHLFVEMVHATSRVKNLKNFSPAILVNSILGCLKRLNSVSASSTPLRFGIFHPNDGPPTIGSSVEHTNPVPLFSPTTLTSEVNRLPNVWSEIGFPAVVAMHRRNNAGAPGVFAGAIPTSPGASPIPLSMPHLVQIAKMGNISKKMSGSISTSAPRQSSGKRRLI